jgi:hypothetical protein
MAGEITKVIPFPHSQVQAKHKWIGKIVIFEMTTGSRIQGKIIGVSEDWIDTDNGAVKVDKIVSAKWVSEDEALIIRGGPLNTYDPYQLRK